MKTRDKRKKRKSWGEPKTTARCLNWFFHVPGCMCAAVGTCLQQREHVYSGGSMSLTEGTVVLSQSKRNNPSTNLKIQLISVFKRAARPNPAGVRVRIWSQPGQEADMNPNMNPARTWCEPPGLKSPNISDVMWSDSKCGV